MAKETIDWSKPYKNVMSGGFEFGDVAWFPEGGPLLLKLRLRIHLQMCYRTECKLQLRGPMGA